VRFLIDENLSPRICALLTAGGHHATHIRDYGMASASDPQVLAKAAAEGLTLITADRGDFGRELALTRAVEPSVILLRQLPDVVRAAQWIWVRLCGTKLRGLAPIHMLAHVD
jgi:predicted nuclease of predicted toxin-antitoxin system